MGVSVSSSGLGNGLGDGETLGFTELLGEAFTDATGDGLALGVGDGLTAGLGLGD